MDSSAQGSPRTQAPSRRSRSIAIPSQTNSWRDATDDENRVQQAQENQYKLSTIRMYNRIIDYRNRQHYISPPPLDGHNVISSEANARSISPVEDDDEIFEIDL